MYKLIEFDIDGTLVDTERTYVLSLVDALKTVTGRDVPEKDAQAVFGIPSHLVPPKFDISEEDAERFSEIWMDRYRELGYLIVPFEGVLDLVRKTKGAGFITAIVTSRSDEEINYDKVTSTFLPYMDIVVSATKTSRHKPNPDPALYGIERAGEILGRSLSAGEVLYLGDTIFDCNCGKGAGADFALADWRNRGMQGIPADYIFHGADEALEIILGHTPKTK